MSAIRVSSRTKVPEAAIIFFHGLGDSGNGWSFLGQLSRQSPEFDHINFVFPNAPEVPITANGGYRMPGWFDVFQFGNNSRVDTEGYIKSLAQVDTLIEEQVKLGIKSENIVIGGFSQGGGLSLGTLVKSNKKLGGIIALSPFVPFHELLKDWNANSNNIATPIFHGHGQEDPLIPLAASNDNHRFFTEELGYRDYIYKTYPGVEHGVDNDELLQVMDFIRKSLPKKS